MKRKLVWRKSVYSFAPENGRDTIGATDYDTAVEIYSKPLGGWEVNIMERHSGTLPECIWTHWERCGFEWFNSYRDALRYAEDVVARSEKQDYRTVFNCRSEWRW